jgi:hypothetical protein
VITPFSTRAGHPSTPASRSSHDRLIASGLVEGPHEHHRDLLALDQIRHIPLTIWMPPIHVIW